MDHHRAAESTSIRSGRPNLVVIGNGMVGHRFVEAAADLELTQSFEVTVFSEERDLAYDRVNLSKYFDASSGGVPRLADAEAYAKLGVTVVAGDPVVEIQRNEQIVVSRSGKRLSYDRLILATGSRPFVPPVDGRDLPGCFVYRTLDDLEQIRRAARGARTGAVIGGGLLGLEAANALRNLGLETHIIEMAPRLMPLQVDDAGGALLRARIEELGLIVHTGVHATRLIANVEGCLGCLRLSNDTELSVDLLVFSAGIRARDELAQQAGLPLGERGGVVIDAQTRTADPCIFAIGECACFEGRTYGLVAPGYRMAETAAGVLAGANDALASFDMSTKLKLLGVDVASFGDAFGVTPGSKQISVLDTVANTYKKLILSDDTRRLLGGMLVGDSSRYKELSAYVDNALELPKSPEDLILPPREAGASTGLSVEALPDTATICTCHNVDKGTLCEVIRNEQLRVVGDVKRCTKAGTGCGSCTTLLGELLGGELRRAGITVNDHLCEHFAHSRQELLHLIRVGKIRTFEELIGKHGKGAGCEICKPAVASILASTYNDYILEPEHAALQDTNDRYLANIQRNGTYSVVPRIAAGEVTPRQLVVLGTIAEKYGLYTKITGAQRIDMFGARVEQLPAIWRDLIDAGFESGHAYGKALRTVKSCVGSTWCRYGVGDSVSLAVQLEHRYKGLRSPHKLKGAVSGCARECAEAQGKDFGVIATENGFNLFICGNGGMKPQHGVLLAQDLDRETLIRYLDRFLMFYVRTADRLQRTANWLNKLEGGLDYLKQVIIDDSLGIAAELEADMANVIDTYQCEWQRAVEDPESSKYFRSFVNTTAGDPSVIFVPERAQHRPAYPDEKQWDPGSNRVHLPVAWQ